MRILVLYLLIINILALAVMGLDKFRARKNKWRIRERTLFLFALAGGSIGVFLGMRLFHHKTRHRAFVIGIPVILCIQVILFIALHFYFPTKTQSAKAVVRSQLQQIRSLDAESIRSFISYESLSSGAGILPQDQTTAQDAVLAFFKDFRYRILSCSLSEDKQSAVVNTQITNIDTAPLTHDLALELTRNRILNWDHASQEGMKEPDFFLLLQKTLEAGSYPLADTQADFSLSWEDDHWEILIDRALQDSLSGGFISRMQDPYLLSPEEVLPVYFEKFSEMDADAWLRFLDKQDIFSTFSPDYADELDHLYMEKIAEYFDWHIDSFDIQQKTASAQITITSIDMPSIMELYRASLLEYAATTQSITDSDEQLADETASRLLEVIRSHAQPADFPIEVQMENTGVGWQMKFDEALSNAILGDMKEGLKVLAAED